MDNTNSKSYRALKAKSYNKRKSSYDFDRTMASITEELLPNTVASNRTGNSGGYDMEKMASQYDKRLQEMEKAQNKRLNDLGQNNEKEIERLGNEILRGDEQNSDLSDSLRSAIERLAQSKGSKQQAQQGQEGQEQVVSENGIEEGTDTSTEEDPFSQDFTASETVTHSYTKPETYKKEIKKVGTALKKVVNIGDSIEISGNSYKITNLFGNRSGENSVPGRGQGEHSNGMDMVGFSADGSVKNLPIALTDGVIVGINLQGNGSAISPTKGKAGGYIMDVKMDDGRIMKYMHLGEDVWGQKANLMNKKIKRGDILYEGDYSKGSGSQTGPHIKVSVTSVGQDGKQLRDYHDPRNDPKTYALYGSYTEEQ